VGPKIRFKPLVRHILQSQNEATHRYMYGASSLNLSGGQRSDLAAYFALSFDG
jgi:hypothetical protein